MTTLQAIILGAMLALTPSFLVLTCLLWSPHDQIELLCRRFENTTSNLIDCAEHINDEITTQQELVARLRLINTCRLVTVAVGFTVSRKAHKIASNGSLPEPSNSDPGFGMCTGCAAFLKRPVRVCLWGVAQAINFIGLSSHRASGLHA